MKSKWFSVLALRGDFVQRNVHSDERIEQQWAMLVQGHQEPITGGWKARVLVPM